MKTLWKVQRLFKQLWSRVKRWNSIPNTKYMDIQKLITTECKSALDKFGVWFIAYWEKFSPDPKVLQIYILLFPTAPPVPVHFLVCSTDPIINKTSFRQEHLGIPAGPDGSDRTSYPVMENQTRPVGYATGRISYLPCGGYHTRCLILATRHVEYYSVDAPAK